MSQSESLQYDIRSKIVFNCQPAASNRLHPVCHVDPEPRTRRNWHQRDILTIKYVVISVGTVRRGFLLEDSKRGGTQKYHMVISEAGACYSIVPPDRYMIKNNQYNIFLEGDFEKPMPKPQMEALRYVLNAVEAICKPSIVRLEASRSGCRTLVPGPFLDENILNHVIFQNKWELDETSWVQK